jgi:hypothetical protein
MSNVDMTRESTASQKKSLSIMATEIAEGAESYEIPAESGNYLLANIPPDAIVTNAYIQVEVASNATTSAVAKLGNVEAGSQVLSAANLKTVGKQGTFTGHVTTGSGTGLFLGVTITGTATAAAKFVVVVEYLEYTKLTGEYTRITN